MIFGDDAHKTYLGCLNCNSYESDSIFNESGTFGHCVELFSENLYCRGIFHKFGDDGMMQRESACSEYSSNPPVIVDQNGRYYGRFSVAGSFGHADSVCNDYGGFQNKEACDLVKAVCTRR
jgi:hypothetical protein